MLWLASVGSAAAQTGPLVENQRLIGSSTGGNILVLPNIRTGDVFGTALAADGDIAVVGAPNDDVFLKTGGTLRVGWRSGAVYVFERNPVTSHWEERQKLFPSLAEVARKFGTSVAIQGNLLLVGDPANRSRAGAAGAAYVFQRMAGSGRWEELQALTALDANENDSFGTSVALDGGRILIGAVNSMNSRGAAYAFELDASGGWQQKEKIAFPALGFGGSVALHGDTAIVGAPRDATNGRDTGSVFVYRRRATTGRWALEQRLFALDTGRVGRARLDGTAAEILVRGLVGPRGLSLDLANGKIYWTSAARGKVQRANLDGTGVEDVLTRGLFVPEGVAVDPAGGKVYWTASFLGQTENPGKVLRASLNGTGVQELVNTDLFPPRGVALDAAAGKVYWTIPASGIERANLDGSGVERLVGGTDAHWIALDVAAGKMYWTETFRIRRANLDGGGVEDVSGFVFGPEGVAVDPVGGFMYWAVPMEGKIRRAKLDGTGVEDVISGLNQPFGVALDLANDMLYWTTAGNWDIEGFGSSLAIQGDTLIVGTENPFYPGSVHVFELNAETRQWEGRQRLTGAVPTGGNADGFGARVDLDGDILAVGAPLERNGVLSGSAYLFRRNPGSGLWGAREKLPPSHRTQFDQFGSSVAVEGEHVLVGAPGAASNSGLAYVFGPETRIGEVAAGEKALASDAAEAPSSSQSTSAQPPLTFDSDLSVLKPGALGHQSLLMQCDDITFSTTFTRLDSLGAPFGSLVGKVFGTLLVTGPWFEGSSSLAILRSIEPGDADVSTIEFSHRVPCSAAVGLTAFTAIQGVSGFTSTNNVTSKQSFIEPYIPPLALPLTPSPPAR